MTITSLILILCTTAMILFIGVANIDYYMHRSKMTPKQRAADDAQMRQEQRQI